MLLPIVSGAISLGFSAAANFGLGFFLNDEDKLSLNPLAQKIQDIATRVGLKYPVDVYSVSDSLPTYGAWFFYQFWSGRAAIVIRDSFNTWEPEEQNRWLATCLYLIKAHDMVLTSAVRVLATVVSHVALKVLIPSFKPLSLVLLSFVVAFAVTEVFVMRWRAQIAITRAGELVKSL